MAKRYDWVGNKKRNYENSLSSIVKSVVKPVIKSNSKVEAEIILNWYSILGDKFFSKVDFKKIKPVERSKKIFNLYVSIRPRDSLEISHGKDLLVEKINTYLGYSAIRDVIISNDKKPSPKNKTGLLSEANSKEVKVFNDEINSIEDEGLATIFRNMERNIGD